MFHPVVRTGSCWYATTAALRRPSLIARRAAAAGDLDPGRRLLTPVSAATWPALGRDREPGEETGVQARRGAGAARLEVGGGVRHLPHHVDLEYRGEPSELDAEFLSRTGAGPWIAACAADPRRSFAEVLLVVSLGGEHFSVSHRATSETASPVVPAEALVASPHPKSRRARRRNRRRGRDRWDRPERPSRHFAGGTAAPATAGGGRRTARGGRTSTGATASARVGGGTVQAEPEGWPGDVWSWY
jgi:hypothetical protein